MNKLGYNHSLMLPKDYVALDLEATGNSRFNYIIEVSAIKVVDGRKIDEYSTLLRPPKFRLYENNKDKVSSYVEYGDEKIYYVDSFIENLTGIDNEMIFFSESEEVVIRKFYEFIKDEVIVGHGMVNDLTLIDSTFKRVLGKQLDSLYIDTFNLGLFLDNTEYSLINLCDRFGIENKEVHRAYSDSYRTFRCYEKIVEELKYKYAEEYEDKFSNWMKGKISSSIKVLKNKTMKSLNRKNWSEILEKYLIDGFEVEDIEGRYFVFDRGLNSKKIPDIKRNLKNLGARIGYKITPKTSYYVVDSLDEFNLLDKNKAEILEKIIFINKNSSKRIQIKIFSLSSLVEIMDKTKIGHESYTSDIEEIYDEDEKEDKDVKNIYSTGDKNIVNDGFELCNKNVYFYGSPQFDSRENLNQVLKDIGANIVKYINRKTDFIIVGEGGNKKLFYESIDCDIFIGILSMGKDLKVINEMRFTEYLDNLRSQGRI